jgi:hypothetical protein
VRTATCLAALSFGLAAFAQAPLTITGAALQTYEDGPAIDAGKVFRAGELAYGSFFVRGFARKSTGEANSEDTLLALSYEVKVTDPEGTPIQAPQTGKLRDTIRTEDKNKDWTPKVRFMVTMPPAPPSGTYRIDLRVTDELGGKEAREQIPFEVKGYNAPRVSELTVANFAFQRTERVNEGPLANPAFKVNETVWVRFDVAGFALGEKNRYDVALGLAVLDATGKVLFEQPGAAELAEAPEYPKRAVPGALSVKIAPGTGKAEYQFRVTVTDRTSGKTAEKTGRFTVVD